MPPGFSPRKHIAMGKDVPWDDMDNLSAAPGDFGMSPTLGGRAPMPNGDAGRKFMHMTDSERCCPPPLRPGVGLGFGNQANPMHVPKTPR